jgi:hypothetical protein
MLACCQASVNHVTRGANDFEVARRIGPATSYANDRARQYSTIHVGKTVGKDDEQRENDRIEWITVLSRYTPYRAKLFGFLNEPRLN